MKRPQRTPHGVRRSPHTATATPAGFHRSLAEALIGDIIDATGHDRQQRTSRLDQLVVPRQPNVQVTNSSADPRRWNVMAEGPHQVQEMYVK